LLIAARAFKAVGTLPASGNPKALPHARAAASLMKSAGGSPALVRDIIGLDPKHARHKAKDLESYLWGAAVLLRGMIDAVTETATTALPDALAGWLQSSSSVRRSLDALLSSTK
jgi:hypothetical protein